jgi:hypothetical protein
MSFRSITVWFWRPRLFRKSGTMRTRSQTRKAQEQASSSASLGDHFDTPHAALCVTADVQPSMAHDRDSVSSFGSLDLPLHTKSASSSCVLPPVPLDCPNAWGHSVVSSAGVAAAFEERFAPLSSSHANGAFKARSSPFTPSPTMAILSRVDAQLHVQDQIDAFRSCSATGSSSGSSSNDSGEPTPWLRWVALAACRILILEWLLLVWSDCSSCYCSQPGEDCIAPIALGRYYCSGRYYLCAS